MRGNHAKAHMAYVFDFNLPGQESTHRTYWRQAEPVPGARQQVRAATSLLDYHSIGNFVKSLCQRLILR